MQRNGQNPIRKVLNYEHGENKSGAVTGQLKSGGAEGICHKCGTSVPPKPGFRMSALKCPKCGLPLGKK